MKVRKAYKDVYTHLGYTAPVLPSPSKGLGKKLHQTQMSLGFEKERLRLNGSDPLLAATLVTTAQKYSKHKDENYGESCQDSRSDLNLWLKNHSVMPETVVCKIPCTGFGWSRDLADARTARIRANKCSYLQHKKQRENANPCEKPLTRKFQNSGLAVETRAYVHLQARNFFVSFTKHLSQELQLQNIIDEKSLSELQCQEPEIITPQPDTLAMDAASHLAGVEKQEVEVEDTYKILSKTVHPSTGNTLYMLLNLRSAHITYVENYVKSGQVRYGLKKSSPLPDVLPVKVLSKEIKLFRDHSPKQGTVEEEVEFIRSLKGDPSSPDPARLGRILRYQDLMKAVVSRKDCRLLKARIAHHLVRLQSLRKPPCMDKAAINRTKMQLRQEMIRNPAYDRVMKSKEVENDAVRYQYFSGRHYVKGYKIPRNPNLMGKGIGDLAAETLRKRLIRDELSGGASYTWESKKPFDTRSEKSANDANNMFVGPLPRETDTGLILPEGVIDLSAARSQRKLIVNSNCLLVPKSYSGENLYKDNGDLNLEHFTEYDKDTHGIKDDE